VQQAGDLLAAKLFRHARRRRMRSPLMSSAGDSGEYARRCLPRCRHHAAVPERRRCAHGAAMVRMSGS